MRLTGLVSRIRRRGRPASAADRALSDARADAVREQRQHRALRDQPGFGMQHGGGGGFDGGT
jgi:hypothetical protein